jgi:uncharacterized protein (DUF1501 family)
MKSEFPFSKSMNADHLQRPPFSAMATPSRRDFLNSLPFGLGMVALSGLLHSANSALAREDITDDRFLKTLHHTPRARRVIFLFQSGGPSQHDLFDYKPELNRLYGQPLPESVRQGQRLTGMSGYQATLPLTGSPFKFKQYGQNGNWFSELLPHTAKLADELCIIKSLHTDAINHGPATTLIQTGSQLPGRPSIGAWLSYGLGSQNSSLPSFVVLVTNKPADQPLQVRLWGSGFLPVRHEGVRFLPGPSPVLYLNNPPGIDRDSRREMLDALNQLRHAGRPELDSQLIETQIEKYELGFRMQESIPGAVNFADEAESTFEAYGPDSKQPGTFAANCILARRLAERGVPFIQLFHPGWDNHGGLPGAIRGQCLETDQASAALVSDLKQRGLLDDTLVIWGGEFGRTNYCQGKLTADDFGRDHHPRCFSMWMAGGGCKLGVSIGQTDELGYNIAETPIHVHDFQATLLHLLGIDHERLTFRHQGRRYRLTDVHGSVISDLLE